MSYLPPVFVSYLQYTLKPWCYCLCAKPPYGDHLAKPPYGNHLAKPPDGNHLAKPPYVNHLTKPPYGNHLAKPPYGNHLAKPPYVNHLAKPPYGNHVAFVNFKCDPLILKLKFTTSFVHALNIENWTLILEVNNYTWVLFHYLQNEIVNVPWSCGCCVINDKLDNM
jgi:hypothetical protein